MQLLLIEDEHRLAAFIRDRLEEQSFDVEVVNTGDEALQRAGTTSYDLIILDVMLPDTNGFEVCKRLREISVEAPVLILSARNLVEDRVKGLDAGADDYLAKPFSVAELTARIRALLRRGRLTEFQLLEVGDLALDPVSRTVTKGGRRIELTAKEFALLEYFMRNAEQVLTRSMIAQHVWDFEWHGLTNVIDVYVNHLRRKLEMPGDPRMIQSVRGVGYVIRAT